MIARRIREHVQTHDWFVVAIDFIIVVAGVFVGIEVAIWNEARQNRAEERRYYSQIRDDLVADIETLRIARQRSLFNDRAAEVALAALDGHSPEGVAPGAVALAFHRAGFLYLPRSARSTYDELVSTGNLGLLMDDRLKKDIVDYYAAFAELRQWDELLREQQKEYWSVSAGVLPRPVLRASMRGRVHVLSSDELQPILEAARVRPRVRDLLIGMAAHQERVRRDSESFERRARRLVDSIGKRV